MSSFTKPLDTRKLTGGRRVLLAPFEYHVGAKESNEIIKVPRGFISDGASIPKFLWSIVGHPFDDYEQAAFLHDFICKHLRKKYNRKQGEQIMYEAMEVLNVAAWKRKIIYAGLRIFGWYLYNKKR